MLTPDDENGLSRTTIVIILLFGDTGHFAKTRNFFRFGFFWVYLFFQRIFFMVGGFQEISVVFYLRQALV